LGIPLRIAHSSRAYAAGLVLCLGGSGGALGDPPADSAPSNAQPPVPAGNFFSSLKQAINQDLDREVVRGHFDLGSPPNAHRYYCLVDAKTGKREVNGVAGQPVLRPDGMTGITSGAVSFYSCANAEQQGSLVSAGYVLSVGAVAAKSQAAPAQQQTATPAVVNNSVSTDKVDVAGVKLGMSPDQVRSVLKSKRLLDYYESAEALDIESGKGAMRPNAGGRFVNIIAAWTSPPSHAVGAPDADVESYEVMFTPVPGNERAMVIVHSVAYSRANAVREMVVENALVTKYGGYSGPSELPSSPTWRIQRGGNVLVGDPCNRRGLFGGLGESHPGIHIRQNIALKTTLDEFRFQIENCGVAIVTEDHSTANADAPRQDRVITRFTVTAYSPSMGFDGAATAAQLMQPAGEPADKAKDARAKEQPAPNL
jgi:hypothetical protein